ncbi:MAG: SPFH domain-containing protein [Myxococcota bacterium]
MNEPGLIVAALGVSLVVLVGLILRRAIVIGEPDEWLLRIRNGRLLNAGIGVFLVKLPWDRVVRFSAAMQRVRFSAEPLSSENTPVSLEAFLLWSISPQGEGPFRAFSKLGIVDRKRLGDPLAQDRKHLLQRPQHHAFQQLLRAAVEQLTPRFSLRELLSANDRFLEALREELVRITAPMGVQVDDVQVLQVRPQNPALLSQLAAAIEHETQEQAAKARLEARQRIQRAEIESATELERERLKAERDHEVAKARSALEAQQEKARLLEAQYTARREELEHQHRLALLEAHHSQEYALAREAKKTSMKQAKLARCELAFAARLKRQRRVSEMKRDAIKAIAQAEEAKSAALREYELARLATVKLAESLKSLPLKNAQWVSVGPSSPVETFASLLTTGRALLDANKAAE